MITRPPLTPILPLLVCACFPVVASAQALPDKQAPQISMYVREVFQDGVGDYWFGTNGDGVCRYDGKSLTYLSLEEGFGGTAVRGILQDSSGAMWFGTDGGVSRYEDGLFTNYTMANGLSDNSVWSMLLDKSGTLWVGTQEGVCRFDGESFVPFPLPRIEIENPESRFSPKVVFGMFEDRAGNLWFGTDGEGAHLYDGKSFTSYTQKDGLAGNVVRCIIGDRDGRIWIGTDGGGVSRFDGKTFRNFTTEDGLNNNRIYEILEDKAGNLWFSTLGAGACRYDGKSFTQFREDHSLIIYDRPARGHVQDFFEDRDGILWLGCSGGLFRFDGESFINVTREGPWPALTQESASTEDVNPMASFERMLPGEWRVTYQSGTSAFGIWNWGPGEHSINVQTDGSGAAGEPWRALEVLYWHPTRKQICLLGLSPYARGVSEGTLNFEGETAEAEFDLHQTSGHREMGRRWTFEGPDKYRSSLWDTGSPPMGEWEFVRSKMLTQLAPRTDIEAPKPSKYLHALEPLVGHTWESNGDWTTGETLQTRSTFEWIPYADYIYVRTLAMTEDAEPTHLLDAYIFHHTGTNTLRYLALSKSGGVFEGDLTVLEGGALKLNLKSYEGEQLGTRVVLLEFENNGTLRGRTWSVEGTERTLMLDVHHRKLEPEKN